MGKPWWTGCGVLVVISLGAWLKQDVSFLIRWTAITGGGMWALSAIFSGALLSGDRIRANLYGEEKADRDRRVQWAANLFWIGVPCILGLAAGVWMTR